MRKYDAVTILTGTDHDGVRAKRYLLASEVDVDRVAAHLLGHVFDIVSSLR